MKEHTSLQVGPEESAMPPSIAKCSTALGTAMPNDARVKASPGTTDVAVQCGSGSPNEPKSRKFYITFLILCLVSLVAAMDSVIVASCLPAITADLKSTTADAFWCGTGFLLAQTVSIPLYGTLSDIFGRKWNFILAISLFLLASVLCATAQNMRWLVAARVVQGLGAGGMLSLVQVIVTDIVSMRERGKYTAMTAFSWALGTIIGIPVGGAIGERTSWRWIFWINIPTCALCIIGTLYALRLRKDRSPVLKKLARVDYLGIVLFIGSSTSFLIGLTLGGTQHPWSSAPIVVPLIVGAIGFIVFLIVEWKTEAPMMPLIIFVNRTAITGFVGVFVHGLALWAYVYYMIVFFLGARQHSLLHASVETLPGGAFTAPSSMFSALIVARTLHFQKLAWVGWTALVVGFGLDSLLTPDSNNGVLYGLQIIASIGGGMLFPPLQFAVQVTQLDENLGVATSTLVFLRSLGQAFGVAIGGTVFQNQFDRHVRNAVAAGVIPAKMAIDGKDAEGAYTAILELPDAVRTAYKYVYADSVHTIWYVLVPITGVGLMFSLLARNESMDRGLNSKQAFEHRKQEPKDEEVAAAKS